MKNLLIVVTLAITVLTIGACGSTQAPSYDKNKAPADKENYSGLQSSAQRQKDDSNISRQTVNERCQQARFVLVDAERDVNDKEISKARDLVDKFCNE